MEGRGNLFWKIMNDNEKYIMGVVNITEDQWKMVHKFSYLDARV